VDRGCAGHARCRGEPWDRIGLPERFPDDEPRFTRWAGRTPGSLRPCGASESFWGRLPGVPAPSARPPQATSRRPCGADCTPADRVSLPRRGIGIKPGISMPGGRPITPRVPKGRRNSAGLQAATATEYTGFVRPGAEAPGSRQRPFGTSGNCGGPFLALKRQASMRARFVKGFWRESLLLPSSAFFSRACFPPVAHSVSGACWEDRVKGGAAGEANP
jgi:hypothetical protein